MCSAAAAAAALATNRGNTFLAGEQLLHGARGSDCLHFTCFAVQQGKQKQNSKITTTREGEGEGVEGGKRSTRLGQATDNLVANNGGHCLVTVPRSLFPLTVPRSLFTNHRSLFTVHCSLFTVRRSPCTVALSQSLSRKSHTAVAVAVVDDQRVGALFIGGSWARVAWHKPSPSKS